VTAAAPGRLRVAAAQAESVSGDVTANVATAVSLVRSAGDRGTRLVVLPELFLTGYDVAAWAPSAAVTVAPDDVRLDPLREAARSASLAVVVGAAVDRDAGGPGLPTLSVVVVAPDGSATAPYDKQHLAAPEVGHFTPGDHGASVVLDGWELGLGVCYDGCFPEHAAAAAAGGATAYLCPSAYFSGSEHRRDLYYAARALDNGIYVVFAGLTGRCGPWEFNGGSAVYEPEGRALGRAGTESPGIVVADLDPAEVVRVQELNPIARDRLDSQGRRRRVLLSEAAPVG
jgi:5-aminopentanamidase